jgi:hypothetical protein
MPTWLKVTAGTVLVVALFVFMHSGARAESLCADAGFSPPAGLSWWPPGARCSGGEPGFASVRFDPACLLAVPIVLLRAGRTRDRARPPARARGRG